MSEGHYSESKRVARKVTVHRRAKSSDSKDGFSGCQAQYKPDKPGWTGSAMQTLDRRISASSDQLDTLKKLKPREKPLRTRSSSRISFERKYSLDESDTEESKPIFTRKSSSKRSIDGPKTPFEMFLEDDGPYSRKLYGPVTPKTPRNRCGAQDASQVRKEKIVYTSYLGQKSRQLEKVCMCFTRTGRSCLPRHLFTDNRKTGWPYMSITTNFLWLHFDIMGEQL